MSDYEYNVKKVLQYYSLNSTYLSHSEAIMTALSLDMWWKEGLLTKSVRNDPYSAWNRLNDVQKSIVKDFRSGKYDKMLYS